MIDVRLADLLRDHARERPEAPALTGDGRTLTFAELDERTNRLAQALRDAGVGAGDRVAHLDQNAPECVELMFAAAKLGAVIVPLNWRLAPPELEAIVADAGAKLLVCGPDYADGADARAERVVVAGEDYEAWLSSFDAEDPGFEAGADGRRLPALHVGRHRPPQGRADHQRQPRRADQGLRRVGARRRLRRARRDAAVPHRRHGLAARGPRAGGEVHPRPLDRAVRASRDDGLRARLQRVPRPDRAADAVRRGGSRRPRLVLPALDGLRGVADHHHHAQDGAEDLRLPAVPGLRAHGGDRRDRPARRRRPRSRRAARAPAALGRQAVSVGGGQDRRPRLRRGAPGRRDRRDPGPRAGGHARLLRARGGVRGRVRRRRLSPHRGRRLPRRRGLPVPHRPHQGHDRVGRRERLPIEVEEALALVAHARERLAGYKLPRRVHVVDELPKTPTGKVLKRELRDRYE